MFESRLQGTSDEATTTQVCEDIRQHGKLAPTSYPGFLRALQRPAPPAPLRVRGDPENINPSNLKENCSPHPGWVAQGTFQRSLADKTREQAFQVYPTSMDTYKCNKV